MNILVVDDLAENRYLIEQIIGGKGHDVVASVDGLDALEKLNRRSFDLIISDIMMPRMDGFELCYNVKRDPRLSAIPFVFYTATYTSDADQAFALSLGAEAFFLKPEEPEVLIRKLDEVLANASNGHRTVARPLELRQDQLGFLKGYNERLIQKLEQKIEESRDANRKLNELNQNLEARVQEKTGQLERSNRELESFAHTLSHDLRAPLRAITGYTDALEESAASKLDAEELSYLTKIVGASRSMNHMIEDVLEYSRIGGGNVSCDRVEIESVVRDVLRSNPDFQKRVEIVNVIPAAFGHEPSLKQVVSNLLSNAVKFVPRGVEPRVRVGSDTRGGDIRLWIEDNGVGIAPEEHAKIFRLFERCHPGYEGTGVGLAIVAKAVERMHGECGVESEPGKGSRFWVQLPRC
jgi:signal transduction histidine kinase